MSAEKMYTKLVELVEFIEMVEMVEWLNSGPLIFKLTSLSQLKQTLIDQI